MIHRGTYDGTIYYNPANKFCIISVKTAEKDVPEEARSTRRRKDHLIRFVATGYELPRTDAVELELDGEWKKGKYGMQLQVEQWHEIVPQTKSGVEGYLASGLIKGIGPALAKQIVSRFGVETLDILQNRPERLLEIKGITENKLEAIKTSYAESRMLQDLMTLLSPFKITPKTAQKIYQFFGPASVDILKKSPFELCQISGFGFLRVDAIVQKNGGDLRAPMRIKGALFWALEDSKGKNGHLFLTSEALQKEALQLLNAKIPIPSLRLHAQEVSDVLEDMILHGEVVSVKGGIYLPRVFAQEDETARRIAMRVVEPPTPEKIEQILEQVKREIGLALSSKQEAAVYAAYRHNLSIITGSPGTGKTTVLKTILEVYRRLHPQGEIALMAPTGRASRRMAESTGVDKAKTLHSILGLASEEDEIKRNNTQEPLSADLIIVDEFSMVDMWLANKFFSRIKGGARVILVGDPDQLPSVTKATPSCTTARISFSWQATIRRKPLNELLPATAGRSRKVGLTGCRFCRLSARTARPLRNSSTKRSAKWSTRFVPPRKKSKSASRYSGSMTGSCRPKTLPRYPMATWDSSAISKMMKMELALDLTSVWAVSWSTA